MQLKIRLQPAVLQRIDSIVGDPAGHRLSSLPHTFVARGEAFYLDRALKGRVDELPAQFPKEAALDFDHNDASLMPRGLMLDLGEAINLADYFRYGWVVVRDRIGRPSRPAMSAYAAESGNELSYRDTTEQIRWLRPSPWIVRLPPKTCLSTTIRKIRELSQLHKWSRVVEQSIREIVLDRIDRNERDCHTFRHGPSMVSDPLLRPNDFDESNGQAILTFQEAQDAAKKLARRGIGAEADTEAPLMVKEALAT